MVERYELWSDPRHMEFIERMLDDDVQNNSVWSFRYFIVMRTSNNGALQPDGKHSIEGFTQELVEREIKYVLEKRLPENWKNEASWVYLRGLLATSQEEEDLSKTSNAKRMFIRNLP